MAVIPVRMAEQIFSKDGGLSVDEAVATVVGYYAGGAKALEDHVHALGLKLRDLRRPVSCSY